MHVMPTDASDPYPTEWTLLGLLSAQWQLATLLDTRLVSVALRTLAISAERLGQTAAMDVAPVRLES